MHLILPFIEKESEKKHEPKIYPQENGIKLLYEMSRTNVY